MTNKILLVGLVLLQWQSAHASYRKHAEFKPADVPSQAAEFIKTAVDGRSFLIGRQIIARKTGQRLHFRRQENGTFWIKFDICLQYRGEGPFEAFNSEIKKNVVLDRRDLSKPTFSWKLHEGSQKGIEEMVNSPKQGFEEFVVSHTELVTVSNGEKIQCRTTAVLTARTPEKALEVISLYFSKFPEDTLLVEDDG